MKKLLSIVLCIFLVFVTTIVAQTPEMDNNAKAAYNEGNKLMKAGDYQGAVAKYDEALQISKDYRIYYQKGVTLKKLRNFAKRIGIARYVVESNGFVLEAVERIM